MGAHDSGKRQRMPLGSKPWSGRKVAASAFFLQVWGVQGQAVLIVGLGLHGLFVNAAQTTMFALCAHVYPTNVRATGTAASLALGRTGSILSAFAGAAVISAAGASAYFAMLGTAMLGVLVALLLVRNHIPPVARRAPAAYSIDSAAAASDVPS